MDILELEQKLTVYLKSFPEKEIKTDGACTKAMKTDLLDMGGSLGFEVSVGGLRHENPEWLYDMVWYKESAFDLDNPDVKAGYLSEVVLVMESEWAGYLKHIKYDFEKLLVANSQLRLMICQSSKSNIYNRKLYFENAIRNYTHLPVGARFLIAIWNFDAVEFDIYPLQKS